MTGLASEEKLLKVSELNNLIKRALESQFPAVKVLGEASGVTYATSGHLYFTLKDESAAIRVVMFKSSLTRLPLSRLENGQQVVVGGVLSMYQPRGEVQIIASSLRPRGIGDIFAELERLKKYYQEKGYFDLSRKRPLPLLPKRIGVVTSPTGAAFADVRRILGRRFPGIEIVLFPARVQGEGAAEEIAAGIDFFNDRLFPAVDVLIVGRGGGSYEDLWAFNQSPVIEAIFRSRLPVISAVGHEIDFTIADFVADLRAATPSAAAELVVGRKQELAERIDFLRTRMARQMENVFHGRWAEWSHSLLDSSLARFGGTIQERIQTLDNLEFELRNRFTGRMAMLQESTMVLAAKLASLDPQSILRKGYSITTRRRGGQTVKDAAQLKADEMVAIRFARGRVAARVLKEG